MVIGMVHKKNDIVADPRFSTLIIVCSDEEESHTTLHNIIDGLKREHFSGLRWFTGC
jgi:hypothetical protein